MELSTVLQRILWVPACHLFCIWVEERTGTRKLHEEGMETLGSLSDCYVLKNLRLVHCRQAWAPTSKHLVMAAVLAALEVTWDWVQYCPVLSLVVVWGPRFEEQGLLLVLILRCWPWTPGKALSGVLWNSSKLIRLCSTGGVSSNRHTDCSPFACLGKKCLSCTLNFIYLYSACYSPVFFIHIFWFIWYFMFTDPHCFPGRLFLSFWFQSVTWFLSPVQNSRLYFTSQMHTIKHKCLISRIFQVPLNSLLLSL